MDDNGSATSHFQRLGAEAGLRAIIGKFIDRVFADTMIGYLFRNADRDRVKDKEYEFAAAHLGGQVEYTGQPLRRAHGSHRILGGHFLRRLQILKDTMNDFEVPQDIQEHWVQHTESMRSMITKDKDSECRDQEDTEQTAPGAEADGAAPAEDSTAKAEDAKTTAAAQDGEAGSGAEGKALPSVAEINAYLDKSAARTKKRLTLAFSSPDSGTGASKTLPLTGSGQAGSAKALPVTGSKSRPLPTTTGNSNPGKKKS